MKTFTKKIKVGKKYAKDIQKHIDDNKPLDEDVSVNGVLEKCFTAKFGKKIEADINIYDTPTGPWIDATLFDNGCEGVIIDPQYVLLGEYPFEYGNKRYVVELETK